MTDRSTRRTVQSKQPMSDKEDGGLSGDLNIMIIIYDDSIEKERHDHYIYPHTLPYKNE